MSPSHPNDASTQLPRSGPGTAAPRGSLRAPWRQAAFVILLLTADVASVFLSFLASFELRRALPWLTPLAHGFDIYLGAGVALLLWPLMFSQQRLYPGYWLTPHDELRRVIAGTTLASLLAMALTFVTQTGLIYSRPILVGGWLSSLILIPFGRFLARRAATRWGLRGPAAILLGTGELAAGTVRRLQEQRPPPLDPVAAFDGLMSPAPSELSGVPVIGPLSAAPGWAKQHGIGTVVIAAPQVPRSTLLAILDSQSAAFKRVLVLSDLLGISGPDVIAHDLQGALALEVRRNLLSLYNLIAKRALDLGFLVASLVITIPLAAVISLAILAEAGQPVLFGHTRVGRNGKQFKAWKFRSMVGDPQQGDHQLIADTPEVREEWATRHKLRADPRVTRIGRILRRTSLDELPQLWNVLWGEMSLVGPRPIVEAEIPRYGEAFHLYTQVPPGLTGLWQVSGRSDTTYSERVELDTHYVRSWSLWMDVVILARTVWVVLKGEGAY